MGKGSNQQLRKEIIESLLIFSLGASMQVFLSCQCWDELNKALIQGSYAGFMWLLLWKGSVYLVSLLDRWVDWLRFPLRRLFASVIGVSLLVFAGTFIIHFIYEYIVYKTPLPDIFTQYTFSWVSNVLIVTYAINIIMHGRGFLLNWKQAAIDIERMKTEQVASQYQSLKNQVNPHFLFNSLNALSSLVYDDQKAAV